jgi:hypothetical protein
VIQGWQKRQPKSVICIDTYEVRRIWQIGTILAKVNQQLLMHQLAVMSIGWAMFLHLLLDGVHHNPFFLLLTIVLTFFLVFSYFFLGPDFTHSYPIHLPTLIKTVPTLVPY